MRILIVGGGISGLTLAALLRQRGYEPRVVEKARQYGDIGYLISLWPLGSRILEGLGLSGAFARLGAPLTTYTVLDGQEHLIKRVNAAGFVEGYGTVRTLARSALLELLHSYDGATPVQHATSVKALDDRGDEVVATFTDGSTEAYDVVVGCDGIHSRVRELTFGPCPLTDYGWSIWPCWWDPGGAADEVREMWGPGAFLGVYPAGDVVASCPVLPDRGPRAEGTDARRAHILDGVSRLDGELAERFRDALPSLDEFTPWALADTTAPGLCKGRIALVGDSGAAFLPTAGIGASVAMEAAAVLADELTRTGPRGIPRALRLYHERRWKRTLAMQQASRWLLRLISLRSAVLTAARNMAVRHMAASRLFQPILDRMEQPI